MQTTQPHFLFPRYLDGANLLTLANVLVGVLGIAAAVAGRFDVGACLLFTATLVDYADGHLARTRFPANRDCRAFGKQLDTLADLTNFGLAPALMVMLMGGAAPAHIAAGGLLVLASVLRLAHFMITSETSGGAYTGLPTTYTGFLLANTLLLHVNGLIGTAAVLAIVLLLSVLQVCSFRLRKLSALTNILAMSALFAVTVLVCVVLY